MKTKHHSKYLLFFAAMFLGLAMTASPAWAQRRPVLRVEVDDIEINETRTPSFGESSHRRARGRPANDWLQFVAKLTTEGAPNEWLDELTIHWHVLMVSERRGETRRLYFQTSTTYIDIKDDSDHYAAVYIRPDTLVRYFDERRSPRPRDMLVYVEVRANNVPVAEKTHNPGRMNVPDDWQRSPRLERIESGLLAPNKTPFQWIDYEFYMTLKPE